MARLWHVLLIGGSCLSGVLFVAAIALWIHSFSRGDGAHYITHDFLPSNPKIDHVSLWYVGSDSSGTVGLGRTQDTILWRRTPAFDDEDDPLKPGWHPRSNQDLFDRKDVFWLSIGRFGIAHHHKSPLQYDSPEDDAWVQCPTWTLIVAFAVWPVVTATRFLCTFRSRRLRRCAACGYDLRATPTRCPECGAATVAKFGLTEHDSLLQGTP